MKREWILSTRGADLHFKDGDQNWALRLEAGLSPRECLARLMALVRDIEAKDEEDGYETD